MVSYASEVEQAIQRRGFVPAGAPMLKSESDSVDLKRVGVVYKLPFASSTKRCETILVYSEQYQI
jgi:hypothetical protein